MCCPQVNRNGATCLVKNHEIVCGDILILDTGDKLIADGVLVETHGLVIDEASLTGESDPIKKNLDHDPWCRSGTQVSEGSGKVGCCPFVLPHVLPRTAFCVDCRLQRTRPPRCSWYGREDPAAH